MIRKTPSISLLRPLAVVAALFVAAPSARAQEPVPPQATPTPVAAGAPAFSLGAVVRTEGISVENAGGRIAVFGAVATMRFSRHAGVEADLTTASGEVGISDEAHCCLSPSAGAGLSPAELVRLAAQVHRSIAYRPGLGGSVMFIAQGDGPGRVDLVLQAGIAIRGYVKNSKHTIVSIPGDVDPALVARSFADSSSDRVCGGLLFGLNLPIALTRQVRLVPELRYVWGMTRYDYREFSVGVRAGWRF